MSWTLGDEHLAPCENYNNNSNSEDDMDVQRAKKCKLWSEGDQQQMPPPAQPARKHPADPCPQLQPFFHQVPRRLQFRSFL